LFGLQAKGIGGGKQGDEDAILEGKWGRSFGAGSHDYENRCLNDDCQEE
jgi:hypothetical protein